MARIFEIEEHKVKTGETLAGLAKDADLTWQELAKFNWGTSVPNEINKHLREDVGCTKKTADGNNYMFDDSDDPGIVFIPKKWEEKGLKTTERHIFRVKRRSPTTLKHVWIEVHGIYGLYDSEPYELEAGGRIVEGKTTNKGVIEELVPAGATTGQLKIDGKTYPIEFVDDELGDSLKSAQIRLNNLGFDCGPVDGIWGPRSRGAMKLFQAQFGIEATGEPDDASLSRLKKEHDKKDVPESESLPVVGDEIPEDVVAEQVTFDGNPEDQPGYFG